MRQFPRTTLLAIVATCVAQLHADASPRFPASATWYQDISAPALKRTDSDLIIAHVGALGGWGAANL